MIREITGMLVIAIAMANTSRNDLVLPFGPHIRCRFVNCEDRDAGRGTGCSIPATKTAPTVRRSSRWNTRRISTPVMNSSRSRPSWLTAASTVGVAPVAGKSQDCACGREVRRSTVAPSSRPPTTSPIARGWRKRTNNEPIPCATSSSAASAMRIWARSARLKGHLRSFGTRAGPTPRVSTSVRAGEELDNPLSGAS